MDRCSFCGSYLNKPFLVRKIQDIKEDLAESAHMGPVRKVFLADGDALCIPQKRLVEVLELVNHYHPEVERIGIYGSAKDVLRKSVDDLRQLNRLKLGIVYLGVETGDESLLKKICKGADYGQLVEAAKKVLLPTFALPTIPTIGAILHQSH